MAHSLAPGQKEPERAKPIWKLPDGEIGGEEDGGSWDVWRGAVERDAQREVVARDPKAETDFWTGAAKDVVGGLEGVSAVDSAELVEAVESVEAVEAIGGNEAGEEEQMIADTRVVESVRVAEGAEEVSKEPPTDSKGLWGLARGITGMVTEMQDKLRLEIERYNPYENTEGYLDIARELVGPPPDDVYDAKPVVDKAESRDFSSAATESSSAEDAVADAEASTGWNPDVDWMRFEDMRREQANSLAADARAESITEEERNRVNALEEVKYTDEDGHELSRDEVEAALREGVVFLDESGAEVKPASSGGLDASSPEGQFLGKLADKRRSSATYGGDWSGAEKEARALQEQGIPLRDPVAERDVWRAAARELVVDIEAESVSEGDAVLQEQSVNRLSDSSTSIFDPSSDADAGEDAQVGPVVEYEDANDVTNSGPVLADTFVEELDSFTRAAMQDEPEISDPGSAWSLWNTGAKAWETGMKEAPSRDAKQEVDMWRSSVREIIGDEQAESSTNGEVAGGDSVSSAKSAWTENAWDDWNKAKIAWESSIADADRDLSSSASKSTPKSPFADPNASSDWGAGLSGIATSDRSAWDAWEGMGASKLGNDQSQWWGSRTDVPTKDSSGFKSPTGGRDNTVQWRQAARDVSSVNFDPDSSGISDASSDSVTTSGQAGKGAAVDFWKSVARDIVPDEVDDSSDNVDEPSSIPDKQNES